MTIELERVLFVPFAAANSIFHVERSANHE